MSTEIQEQQARYDAEKQARVETRKQQLLARDFSQYATVDALYDDLSSAEIKMLTFESPAFKKRLEELHEAGVQDSRKTGIILRFRALTPEGQQEFLTAASPEVKAIIEEDMRAFAAQGVGEQPPAPPIPAALSEPTDEEKAAAQAEADRKAAEASAANQPAAPSSAEELYDGIEKLGSNSYKLTVDPGDGTPAEIFYGESQKECFKKLRKSKANATKELRRRRAAVKITDDLKALEADKISYAPLIQPVPLTADEIYKLTKEREKLEDDLSDPAKVLAAKQRLRVIDRKLELASLTPEECADLNKPELERRFNEQRDTAILWMRNNPKFYPSQENIQKFQELMSGLNWAVTINNMDRAFKILKEQDVLSDPVEESDPAPVSQPASVVPVVTAPPAPALAAPAPVSTPVPAPAAPAGGLPEAPVRVLRPGSSSTATMPTRRVDSISHEAPKVVLTAETYNAMPASEVKRKYQREPEFAAAVDKLIREGKI